MGVDMANKLVLWDITKIEFSIPTNDIEFDEKIVRYEVLQEDFLTKVQTLAEGYNHLGLDIQVVSS